MGYPRYTDGQTYARSLYPRKYGVPLWYPEPNASPTFPQVHRNTGIRVGDVGILTAEGRFDFVFNICYPRDDPIQWNSVPSDFEQLVTTGCMQETTHHLRRGALVYSLDASTKGINLGGTVPIPGTSLGVGAAFEINFSKGSGAALSLPNGGSLLQTVENRAFKRHARKYAKSWYHFVNAVLGWDAPNGSLYLVTGHIKSDAWDMAVVDNPSSRQSIALIFDVGLGAGGRLSLSRESRLLDSVSDRTSDDLDQPVPKNQTMFVRGFQISVSNPRRWQRSKVLVATDMDTKDLFRKRDGAPYSGEFPAQGGGYSDTPELSRSSSSSSTDSIASENYQVTLRPVPEFSESYHPLTVIHEFISGEQEDVEVVVTHDDDWTGLFEDTDTEMPDDTILLQRFQDRFTISIDEGIIWGYVIGHLC
ncbi:serine threonine-protein [Moniliophthora roreri]|nr:serine threonine-protein [Moniliophthora roreri]